MIAQVTIEIGDLVLEPSRDGWVWLSRKDGEGMEVEESKLAACLEAFYAENF